MAKITLKQDFLKDLQKAIEPTLWEFQKMMIDDEVIPFQTGELQESADVIKIRKGYALEYDVDYAETVYYHPEIVTTSSGITTHYFHNHKTKKNFKHHGKIHKDYNRKAMPNWIDAYLSNIILMEYMYINSLKNNSKYVS